MKIAGREYDGETVRRRVGDIAQLGGTRHVVLAEGRAKGVAAIEIDTGAGLRATVLPDRGMDISAASFKGTNLVYLAPGGEAHPAFYESRDLEWLRTFFGGLLTTCGLTHFSAPCMDEDEELGLHGRVSNTPARRVADLSDWDGDEYRVELRGVVEEASVFGHKLRLTRRVRATLGEPRLAICDELENFGHAPAPLTILYHINIGFPLLDESTRLRLTSGGVEPCDEGALAAPDAWDRFEPPADAAEERNFLHRAQAGPDGRATAVVFNRSLGGGLGLALRFDPEALPWLNQWKLPAAGEYVLAIEPCNAPERPRARLRDEGLLPMLAPGERRATGVEFEALDGADAIEEALARAGLA